MKEYTDVMTVNCVLLSGIPGFRSIYPANVKRTRVLVGRRDLVKYPVVFTRKVLLLLRQIMMTMNYYGREMSSELHFTH